MNDAVRSEPTSVLRIGPVGGQLTIKLQEKNRTMLGEVITIANSGTIEKAVCELADQSAIGERLQTEQTKQ